MSIPADLHYTAEHEWLRLDGDLAVVGITAYAADALGDIVFLELPEPGTAVAAGQSCGEIESTKSVSDLMCPADGEVLATNPAVGDDPGLVNADPYGDGWLFRLRVGELPELLDAAAYAELTGGER